MAIKTKKTETPVKEETKTHVKVSAKELLTAHKEMLDEWEEKKIELLQNELDKLDSDEPVKISSANGVEHVYQGERRIISFVGRPALSRDSEGKLIFDGNVI